MRRSEEVRRNFLCTHKMEFKSISVYRSIYLHACIFSPIGDPNHQGLMLE